MIKKVCILPFTVWTASVTFETKWVSKVPWLVFSWTAKRWTRIESTLKVGVATNNRAVRASLYITSTEYRWCWTRFEFTIVPGVSCHKSSIATLEGILGTETWFVAAIKVAVVLRVARYERTVGALPDILRTKQCIWAGVKIASQLWIAADQGTIRAPVHISWTVVHHFGWAGVESATQVGVAAHERSIWTCFHILRTETLLLLSTRGKVASILWVPRHKFTIRALHGVSIAHRAFQTAPFTQSFTKQECTSGRRLVIRTAHAIVAFFNSHQQ